MADVERNDANGVARQEEFVALAVIEGKGKDAAEFLEEVDAAVAVQRQDDLAVRPGLEIVAPGIMGTDVAVVVYLTIHGQHGLTVGRIQRLATRLGVDDRQPLVGEDG